MDIWMWALLAGAVFIGRIWGFGDGFAQGLTSGREEIRREHRHREDATAFQVERVEEIPCVGCRHPFVKHVYLAGVRNNELSCSLCSCVITIHTFGADRR